jgi:Lon protease-like protein
MQKNSFKITSESLPLTLPVFPISGVLLLPNVELPLNIFEPRYINMVQDALATPNRLIGLAQPIEVPEQKGLVSRILKGGKAKPQEIYNIGCAGKIRAFSETEDGRYLITVQGISRFNIVEEVETDRGYRRFAVDFSNFTNDLDAHAIAQQTRFELNRKQLVELVDSYLKKNNIEGSISNLQGFGEMEQGALVDFLCSYLPFIPQEKQLFLEASTTEERSKILFDILGLANIESEFDSKTIH